MVTQTPAPTDVGTRLAVDRTRLAYGRTLMAWVRLQHRQSLAALRATYGGDVVPYSTATLVAGLFSVLGVLAMLAVALHQ